MGEGEARGGEQRNLRIRGRHLQRGGINDRSGHLNVQIRERHRVECTSIDEEATTFFEHEGKGRRSRQLQEETYAAAPAQKKSSYKEQKDNP